MALNLVLHFVRHGQSQWNAAGRLQGQAAAPGLTPVGVEQATAAGRALARVARIDRVLSSDLTRAVETAALIGAALGLPVEVEPRLREQSMGRLEGLASAAAFEATAGLTWSESARLGGASSESVRDVAARVGSLLAALMSDGGLRSAVLVSHGDTIRIALAWLAATAPDDSFRVGPLANGSITSARLVEGVLTEVLGSI